MTATTALAWIRINGIPASFEDWSEVLAEVQNGEGGPLKMAFAKRRQWLNDARDRGLSYGVAEAMFDDMCERAGNRSQPRR